MSLPVNESHVRDRHGSDGEPDHDTLHITVGGYVTGFVLSVVLTAIPFWLVMAKVFESSTVTIFVILAFAMVQIYVHMVFFLHMTSKAEGGWAWMSLIFMLVLLVIMLSGSIWIMHHLQTHTMPLTPEQVRKLPYRGGTPNVHGRSGIQRPLVDARRARYTRRLIAPVGGRAGRHRRRGDHRADGRVLRLLRLRHRFGAGVSNDIFPSPPPEGTCFVHSLRGRIHRPADRHAVLFMDIQRRWGRYTKFTLALFLLGTSTAGMPFAGYDSLGVVAIACSQCFGSARA
jgi:cytochrome o ubiquinol oxidase operon protein cyoD